MYDSGRTLHSLEGLIVADKDIKSSNKANLLTYGPRSQREQLLREIKLLRFDEGSMLSKKQRAAQHHFYGIFLAAGVAESPQCSTGTSSPPLLPNKEHSTVVAPHALMPSGSLTSLLQVLNSSNVCTSRGRDSKQSLLFPLGRTQSHQPVSFYL